MTIEYDEIDEVDEDEEETIEEDEVEEVTGTVTGTITGTVEEEEEEEVSEVTINGKTYYTNNEINGTIYAVDEDGEIGDEAGKFVKGVATFNA